MQSGQWLVLLLHSHRWHAARMPVMCTFSVKLVSYDVSSLELQIMEAFRKYHCLQPERLVPVEC